MLVSDGQQASPALDALLLQTYRNLEVLVCDVGSTDGPSAVCAECAARDERVTYLRHEGNRDYRGSEGTFRSVVTRASGEYFMWTSARDSRGVTAVEECVEALRRNPRAVMAHGPIEVTFTSRPGMVVVSNQMDLTSSSMIERVRTFTTRLEHHGMVYGLFKRQELAAMTFGDHVGHVYLTCLQACLHGQIEYVSSPIIRYQQQNEALDTSMYPLRPMTLTDLLTCRSARRYKCWVTLLMGCRRVLTHRNVQRADRMAGASVFAREFIRRYRRHLASELVFLLFTPVQCVAPTLASGCAKFKARFTRRTADAL